MKWTDTIDIAIALNESHPYTDVANISFVELHSLVLLIPGFDGNPDDSNERILEAIQAAWLDEKD